MHFYELVTIQSAKKRVVLFISMYLAMVFGFIFWLSTAIITSSFAFRTIFGLSSDAKWYNFVYTIWMAVTEIVLAFTRVIMPMLCVLCNLVLLYEVRGACSSCRLQNAFLFVQLRHFNTIADTCLDHILSTDDAAVLDTLSRRRRTLLRHLHSMERAFRVYIGVQFATNVRRKRNCTHR